MIVRKGNKDTELQINKLSFSLAERAILYLVPHTFMSLISEIVRILIKLNIVDTVKLQYNYYPNKH